MVLLSDVVLVCFCNINFLHIFLKLALLPQYFLISLLQWGGPLASFMSHSTSLLHLLTEEPIFHPSCPGLY